MFSARWAHRALVGFCIFLAVVAATALAWEGWFGNAAQTQLRLFMEPVAQLVRHGEWVERMARLLGALGTALTAAFGVYKGIYYADRNLPERLKVALQKTDERLRRDRVPLLNALTEVGGRERVRPSVFYVFPLTRALRDFGFQRPDSADASLKAALQEIDQNLQVSAAHQRTMEEQKVLAHILRGSILSARADYKAAAGASPDNDRHAAEKEFDLALDLRSADLDALELRGRQRELRGNFDGALSDYERFAAEAEQVGDAFRTARAYRLQGELMERHATTQQALQAAGRRLDAALKTMNTIGSLKHSEIFEKGLLLKAYGRVQASKKRVPSARTHFGNAAKCFNQLKTPEAKSHAREIAVLLRELEPPSDGEPVGEKKSESWFGRWFG